jgi:hypothetical protein
LIFCADSTSVRSSWNATKDVATVAAIRHQRKNGHADGPMNWPLFIDAFIGSLEGGVDVSVTGS